MRDAQVHDKECRSCSVGNVGIKLDVSTLLNPASGNVGLDLGGGEQELSQLLHCPIMRLLCARLRRTRANMTTQGIKGKPPAATSRGRQRCNSRYVCTTASSKKVCQRLAGQASSLRVGRITPSQAMGRYQSTRFGALS